MSNGTPFETIAVSDYQKAMRKPSKAFDDPDLQGRSVAKNSIGWPAANTGGFAAVYRMTNRQGRSKAVRCFIQLAPDMAERYSRISERLKEVVPAQDRKEEFFVKTDYFEIGIKIDAGWKPITTMQWIDGEPLDIYLDRAVREEWRLPRLRSQIENLARSLARFEIGHGDLQHRNILIETDGAMRLIDYDGMWVRALADRRSNEIGTTDYQHPGRTWEHYGPGMDRFSLLVLWLTVFAIEHHPEIWRQERRSEGLLLRRSDFEDPDESPMLTGLHAFDDLAPYVQAFRRACRAPVTDTPWLMDFIRQHQDVIPPVLVARSVGHEPSVEVKDIDGAVPDTLNDVPVVELSRGALTAHAGEYVTVSGAYVRFEKGDTATGAFRNLYVTGLDGVEVVLLADPIVVEQVRRTGRSWKVTRGQPLTATGLLLEEDGRFAIQLDQAASLVRGARPVGPRAKKANAFYEQLFPGDIRGGRG